MRLIRLLTEDKTNKEDAALLSIIVRAVETYRSKVMLNVDLETAGPMLGTNKSRSYCLEMICADFLAGAGLESQSPQAMLLALCRPYELLPDELKQTFSARLRKSA
jgi:hypothetical protein